MSEFIPLTMVSSDREVTLISITGGRRLRARLNSMGLNEGMRLKVLQTHRFGPCIILLGDTRLALGYGMASKILVKE